MSKNFLNGYYTVNNEIIESKVYAILRASELNSELKWCFHDDVYTLAISKFKSNDLSILELYKVRAQQLRDSYDYLILNYSGGADSHNILHTFLSNNIKIDHIFVQWPEQLMDKGLYTPNAVDKSNANFHSEWELVLKKDLKWIGENRPDITIEVADWTNTVNANFYTDDLFSNSVSNLPSISRSQKQNTFSKIESKLALAGKSVASIFGVDKPNIVKQGNSWYMYFTDTSCMAQANPDNPHGTEYFYWTPDMPEIPILQSHLMIEWFKENPLKQYLIATKEERVLADPTFKNWPYEKHYLEYAEIAEICKLVCYPHWDFLRFQAEKPFSQLKGLPLGVRAWDNILTALPDFNKVQQAWEYHWKSYLKKINLKFMRSYDTVAVSKSKFYLIN